MTPARPDAPTAGRRPEVRPMVRAGITGLFAESGTSWNEEHAGVRDACRVGPREFLKEFDLTRTPEIVQNAQEGSKTRERIRHCPVRQFVRRNL